MVECKCKIYGCIFAIPLTIMFLCAIYGGLDIVNERFFLKMYQIILGFSGLGVVLIPFSRPLVSSLLVLYSIIEWCFVMVLWMWQLDTSWLANTIAFLLLNFLTDFKESYSLMNSWFGNKFRAWKYQNNRSTIIRTQHWTQSRTYTQVPHTFITQDSRVCEDLCSV